MSSSSSTPTNQFFPKPKFYHRRLIKEKCIACIDVEVDGISPEKSSLRQLGLVVISIPKFSFGGLPNDYVVFKHRWNISPQEGKIPVPSTMEWFRRKASNVLAEIESRGEPIDKIMDDFAISWKTLNETYEIQQIIASPSSVDYMWVRMLYEKYSKEDWPVIHYKWICLSSQLDLCSELTGLTNHQLLNMFNPLKLRHSHFADEDALVQAVIFLNLKDYIQKLSKKINLF
jgi:hypothetical protein